MAGFLRVTALLALLTVAGCSAEISPATSAKKSARASAPERIEVPLKIGLYVSPAVRDYTPRFYGHPVEVGLRLGAEIDEQSRRAFRGVTMLGHFPPSADEQAGLDAVLVVDKASATFPRHGLFDWTQGLAVSFALHAADGRTVLASTEESSVQVRMAALDPAENIDAWNRAVRAVSRAVVTQFLRAVSRLDVAGLARAAVAATPPGPGDVTRAGSSRPGATATAGGGVYALEAAIDFNVLDAVDLDGKTGRVTLGGHHDDRFGGPPIPYLQHLAVLLEHQQPRFTLEWTPESALRIDQLFHRLDSPDEVRRIAAAWGGVVDEGGRVTLAGCTILPLWGVRPIGNGAAAGYLGAGVQAVADRLHVTAVVPGSPAAAAGLRVGDVFVTVNQQFQPLTPDELDRLVRFAGAGVKLPMQVERAGQGLVALSATLGAAPDDPWTHVDRYDIVERILRASGQEQAAWITNAMGVWGRMRAPNGDQTNRAIENIFGASAGWPYFIDLKQKVFRKEIAPAEATRLITRAACAGMDKAFGLAGGPVVGAWEAAMRAGRGPENAVDAGIAEMNRQLRGVLDRAIQTQWRRHDQIQIPPEMMQATLGVRPEVVPERLDVDGRSQLARVMFEADYLSHGQGVVGSSCDRLMTLSQYATFHEMAVSG